MSKIKIVFLVNRLNVGGMESALFNLINLMDKEKFDISVFTIHPYGGWEQKFKNAGINVIDQYSGLKKRKSIFGKAYNFVAIKYIENARAKNPHKILGLVKKNGFDLIVSYQVFSPDENIGFPDFGKTIKYVHGNVYSNESYGELQKKLLNVNDKYDRIICVSKDSQKAFSRMTGRYDGITTVFNPIDAQEIIRLSKEEIDFKFPYICAVGRFTAEKGFVRLIKVFTRLLEAGCSLKLVIVGEGKEKEEMIEIIREKHNEENIFLVGHKENPYPYIKNSIFTVLPSFTEGLPVVAMESICLGVPIVSSYPSAGEIFGNEQCGVITDIDDNSLYQGMQKMINDKEFYQKTKLGAERQSVYFLQNKMVREAEKEFVEVLSED